MDLHVRNLIDPAVDLNLRANGLSRLTILRRDDPDTLTRVVVPGGCVARVGGHEVHIPVGEERAVLCDTGDYELTQWTQEPGAAA